METNHNASNERRMLRRRRQMRQLLGGVVCILVIVGLFSIIGGGIRMTTTLITSKEAEEKIAFESRLQTLVALDPVPFDSLTEASGTIDTLLCAAIWGTVAEIDKDTVERDEVGAMYLPTAAIDVLVEVLYGPDFKFNYQTFTSKDLQYTYVPEKEAYLVPITSAVTDYYPRVERIQKKGDTKRVTVGYISLYNEAGEFNPNAVLVPVKYNDYIFTKHDKTGEYFLTAIVASDMKVENANSNSSSVSVAPEDAILEAIPDLVLPSSSDASQSASETDDAQNADESQAEPAA